MIRIQYGEERYRQSLIDLWRICFPEDSPEFRTFYFDRVYRHHEALIALDNGRPVAFLQMIPYRIKLNTAIVPAIYLSGVMTHPDCRRQGVMGKLLQQTSEIADRRQIPILFLIPQGESLFRYYAAHGYQKAFPRDSETITFSQMPLADDAGNRSFRQYKSSEETDPESLYPIYSRFLRQQQQAVLKTKQQFRNILDDLFLGKGSVFAAENAIALALPSEKEDTLLIKECFCETETRPGFLSSIASLTGKRELIVRRNTPGPESCYYGMMRLSDGPIKPSPDIYMNTMLD